jgi:hypothetical protein
MTGDPISDILSCQERKPFWQKNFRSLLYKVQQNAKASDLKSDMIRLAIPPTLHCIGSIQSF